MVEDQVTVPGICPVRSTGKVVKNRLEPGALDGLTNGSRRLQAENRSVAVGAVVASRSVKHAIRAKNHPGVRVASILVLMTKAVEG